MRENAVSAARARRAAVIAGALRLGLHPQRLFESGLAQRLAGFGGVEHGRGA